MAIKIVFCFLIGIFPYYVNAQETDLSKTKLDSTNELKLVEIIAPSGNVYFDDWYQFFYLTPKGSILQAQAFEGLWSVTKGAKRADYWLLMTAVANSFNNPKYERKAWRKYNRFSR